MIKMFSFFMIFSFFTSCIHATEYYNHSLNYGITKSDLVMGGWKTYRPWGAGVEYQYRPLNFLNIFVSSDMRYQKMEERNVYNGALFISIGYRIPLSSQISLTPFVGRSGHTFLSENQKGENTVVGSGATNLGILAEYSPTQKFTIGLSPMVQFFGLAHISHHYLDDENKFSDKEYTSEEKIGKLLRIDLPLSYKVSKHISLFGKLTRVELLNARDAAKKGELRFSQIRLGLAHSF